MKHPIKIASRLHRRGISLIEGVLYLVVALAIIVGGIVFFQQASFNRQVNSVAGMMTSVSSYMIATAKNASQTRAEDDFLAGDATAYVIKSGAIQSDLVGRATSDPDLEVIRSPWGGTVTLREAAGTVDGSRTPIVAARLNDLPIGACMRLGHKNKNGTSMIGGSVFALGVEENNIHDDNLDWTTGEVLYMAKAGEDTDMAALAEACEGGTRDLVIYYDVAGVPNTFPDMTGGGTDTGIPTSGEDDTGTPTSGENDDGTPPAGEGGGSGSPEDPHEGFETAEGMFCPPTSWSWNAATSKYTVAGWATFHYDKNHENVQFNLYDPGRTSEILVPNPTTFDLMVYAFPHRGRSYWELGKHVEGYTLLPRGADGC